jgi:hypothetical protein
MRVLSRAGFIPEIYYHMLESSAYGVDKTWVALTKQ